MNSKRPTQAAIGRALGLSPAAISKLKAAGMPTHSAAAARAWRLANLDPARRKPDRRPTGADDALREVAELGELAEQALQFGRFDLIAPALRAALRAVPLDHRSRVGLPLSVWDALVYPLSKLIDEAIADDPAGTAGGACVADEEADAMGGFWYGIAAEGRAALPD